MLKRKNKLLLLIPLFSALLFGCQTTGQTVKKGTPLSGKEISEIFSGNTMIGVNHERGRQFRMYYNVNGIISATADDHGQKPDSDHGKWWVEGDLRCTQYNKWGEGKKWCKAVYRDGDTFQTFSQDGANIRETFSVKAGNPHSL